MTEERTQYTVTGLQIENELLRERNEALRKTVDGFTDASNFQWTQYQRRIKELEQTVQRLEADNKRLRHLDAMPLDAFARYWANSGVPVFGVGYESAEYEADYDAIVEWFNLNGYVDGDA